MGHGSFHQPGEPRGSAGQRQAPSAARPEVELEAELGGVEVETGPINSDLQVSHGHLVEAVHRRDELGYVVAGGNETSTTLGRGPHQVGHGAHRRLRPVPDDEAVAGAEPGAGDDPYERELVRSVARRRLLATTPQEATAKATETTASDECTTLKPVECSSSPMRLRRKTAQMNTVQAAVTRMIRAPRLSITETVAAAGCRKSGPTSPGAVVAFLS